MLSKYLDGNHDEWDLHIPLLMIRGVARISLRGDP